MASCYLDMFQHGASGSRACARAAPLTRTGATLVESCSHLELSQIGLCFEDGGPCGLVSYLPEVCVYMGHLASAPEGKDRWSLSS